VDVYGTTYQDNETITVLEKPPEIVGPFTFYGAEGQGIALDVEIYDAFLDEVGLSYEWFNSTNQILANRFSTDKKPVIFLNQGTYAYSLKVTDALDQTTTANVSVVVEDIAPSAFASGYMYHGTPGGTLDLYAYGLDSYLDYNDLKFYWTIAGANYTHSEADETAEATATSRSSA